MFELPAEVEKYLLSIIDPEEDYLNELYRETYLKVLNPNMISGHIQGKVLAFISTMIQPSSILEIGTYTGYSAFCLAKGLAPGGKLHTIDKNDELADYHNKYVKRSHMEDSIVFHYGDALKIMDEIELIFDLVFIDADKEEYPEYYHKVKNKVRKGGYIIADNIFWDGKVLQKGFLDKSTKGILEFTEIIKNDPGLEKVVLPVRDGLMIIRKK